MAATPNRRFIYRFAALIFAFVCFHRLYESLGNCYHAVLEQYSDKLLEGKHETKSGRENLGMTEQECRTTFPGLLKEVDESIRRGPFQLERASDDYMGLIQGRIADGKVRCCSPPMQQMLMSINSYT